MPRHADRFDRPPLVLPVAYILPVGIGHYARLRYYLSNWCSHPRRSECGAFAIGRRLPDRIQVDNCQAVAILHKASKLHLPNWG